MRRLLALLLLAAVTAPSLAGGHRGFRGRGVGWRNVGFRGFAARRFGFGGYDRSDPHGIHARVERFHQFFGHSGRPYWHHPYYLRRFGGFRPYQHYRLAGACGYGWGGGFNLYYPPAVAIAPIYSRLSVVLTLDDAVFDGPQADHDGLPRSREGLVGNRFLVDLD